MGEPAPTREALMNALEVLGEIKPALEILINVLANEILTNPLTREARCLIVGLSGDLIRYHNLVCLIAKLHAGQLDECVIFEERVVVQLDRGFSSP